MPPVLEIPTRSITNKVPRKSPRVVDRRIMRQRGNLWNALLAHHKVAVNDVIGNIVVGAHAVLGLVAGHAAFVGCAGVGRHHLVERLGTRVVSDCADWFAPVGVGDEVVLGAGAVDGLGRSDYGFGV